MCRALAVSVFLWLFALGSAAASPIPSGTGSQTVQVNGISMTVYTYRPNCQPTALLLVFHGVGRNPDSYLKSARQLGDQMCLLVIAPLFDAERFPTWAYQRGGIVRQNRVQNPSQWTGQLVLHLTDWAQRQEGRGMDYYLLGHSAGGQFLSRVAAFTPTRARRIVIANPSTHVFASLQVHAPFGLGLVYPPAEAEAQLRRYLAQPLTIFLGQGDEGDENLSETPEAMAQGATRYERGRNAYYTAQRLAQSRGWVFNWRLVEVPGVGHSARRMFRSPQALAALRP